MSRQYWLPTIALGAMLAACTNQGMTYDASDPIVHIDGFYSDGVAGRDLMLVVDGNPFNMPSGDFARLVEADIKDNAIAQRGEAHPTLTPGPTAKPLYRLVYVFEPGQGVYGDAICYSNAPSQIAPATPGKVTAMAAFCVGYRAMSFVTGETAADGPSDARIYHLVRHMEDAVFRPDVKFTGPPNNLQS